MVERLHVRRWAPRGEARAIVHVAHGMGEHCARYERFACALTDAGYAVMAHDHRGHGRSVASPEELGSFGAEGWEGLVADLSRVHEEARGAYPGIPFVAFGHSMGSFALQQLLLDESDRIDAAILSGSAAADALLEPLDLSEPLDFGAFNEAFEPARTEADWLSRDPTEVDAYVADSLCGFTADVPAMQSFAAGAARMADPAELAKIRKDLPVYIFAGDADPVNAGLAHLELLVERYRAAGLTDITTRWYEGGRHEMLNETNRDQVTRDLLRWLEKFV